MKNKFFFRLFMLVGVVFFCLAFVQREDEQQQPMVREISEEAIPTGANLQGGSRSWTLPVELFFPATTPKDVKARNFLMDLSHGAYFDTTPQSQFSSFISLLQSLGFNVTVTSDFANIMTYDVVMANLPQSYYSAADVTLLSNYLDADKIFILQGEWGSGTPWHNLAVNALLSSLTTGIQVQSSMVYEPVFYYIYNYWILIQNYTSHCLNDNVSQVIHPLPSHLSVNDIGSVVYYSTANSYLETGGSGPFVIAAVPDPTVHPNWKMFIVGDTNPFSYLGGYDYLNMYDNAQLATNVVFWCEGCADNNDCDDGDFCNGYETCNQTTYECEAGTPPCPDDGLFCNGAEGCDETNDQCTSAGDPCPDDGQWCNGTESCDETNDQCASTGNPCTDDGQFCNGAESCDETNDQCTSAGDPCPDDGQWCNGTESCDETNDQCASTGNPCADDGQFCNGEETCDETNDQCASAGNPCPDDGQWCNGTESCNETDDQCDSTGLPCEDDGLFCNGEETCDETSDECAPGAPPCEEDETCNEDTDTCDRGEDDDSDPDPSEDDDDAAPSDDEIWPEGQVSGGCCGCN